MIVRRSTKEDVVRMLEIYAHARSFMKETGNPDQWHTYPSEDVLLNDIEKKISYCIEENGEIYGTFVFILGPDPTYSYIEEGNWTKDVPYGTIHRIASDGRKKGILHEAVTFATRYVSSLRIDTHPDNKVMQHQIGKEGFVMCGIIYCTDDLGRHSARIAYQKDVPAFTDILKERCSVRKYSSKPVREEDLFAILEAGRIAPTAANKQPQKIFVLKSEEALTKIRKVCRSAFDAPLVLLVCYQKDKSWKHADGYDSGEVDCAIVTTQMMLQAQALGIGSLWVRGFDAKDIIAAFDLEENLYPVCLLDLGYVAQDYQGSKYHEIRNPLFEEIVEL